MDDLNQAFAGVNLFTTPSQSFPEPIDLSVSQEKIDRDYGRWSIAQGQRYLEVISSVPQKYLIKSLVKALPSRAQSQIRAHHQKMIQKYGSINKILQICNHPLTLQLYPINSKINHCLHKLTQLTEMRQLQKKDLINATSQVKIEE